jgi:AcrR family transcriptional regulator
MTAEDALAAVDVTYPAAVTSQPSSRRTRRARLLDAAMDVFAEKGFTGATISEIERRVGLAAGTGSLYRHFPSKEALLREAVAHEVARCRAEIDESRAELASVSDALERRKQRYRQMLQNVRRFDRLFRLMLNEGDRVPELAEAIWAAVQRPIQGDPGRDESVLDAIAMTSIGGYHLFSLMQGRPFNGISQERLTEVLARITEPKRGRDRQ